MTLPGLQNQVQKAPKIEAKSLPASIVDPIFKLFLSILEGRSVKMASKIASKTAWPSKLLQDPILTPSGLDFGASGS